MIKALGLFYALDCTAACEMCVTGSSPDRAEKMELDEALAYISQTGQVPEANWISINGGEPLKYHDDICRILSLAKTLGKKTKISSNGFWATTRQAARRKLRELVSSGLDFISLSTDVYHTKFIPVRNIQYCLEAASDEGIMREVTIVVDRKSGRNSEKITQSLGLKIDISKIGKVNFLDNNVIVEELKAETAVNIMPLQPFGRAEKLMRHCFLRDMINFKEQTCSRAGEFPYVLPGGDVFWCCNLFACGEGYVEKFKIGNLQHDSLVKLNEELKTNAMIKILAEHGPGGLLWLLSFSQGRSNAREKFASLCDLCVSTFTGNQEK